MCPVCLLFAPFFNEVRPAFDSLCILPILPVCVLNKLHVLAQSGADVDFCSPAPSCFRRTRPTIRLRVCVRGRIFCRNGQVPGTGQGRTAVRVHARRRRHSGVALQNLQVTNRGRNRRREKSILNLKILNFYFWSADKMTLRRATWSARTSTATSTLKTTCSSMVSKKWLGFVIGNIIEVWIRRSQ